MAYYDPYHPLREELARTGAIFQRATEQKSATDLARRRLELGHEGTILELGLRSQELADRLKTSRLARDTGNLQKRIAQLQLKKVEQTEAYNNLEMDFDDLGARIGTENAEKLIPFLPSDRTEVMEDGKIKTKLTNMELGQAFSSMSKFFPQDKVSKILAQPGAPAMLVHESGKTTSLGFNIPQKPEPVTPSPFIKGEWDHVKRAIGELDKMLLDPFVQPATKLEAKTQRDALVKEAGELEQEYNAIKYGGRSPAKEDDSTIDVVVLDDEDYANFETVKKQNPDIADSITTIRNNVIDLERQGLLTQKGWEAAQRAIDNLVIRKRNVAPAPTNSHSRTLTLDERTELERLAREPGIGME